MSFIIINSALSEKTQRFRDIWCVFVRFFPCGHFSHISVLLSLLNVSTLGMI
nr:MAG TPA: Vacuolar sorting protein 39 domain 2 [Caudoviricetes sp.]